MPTASAWICTVCRDTHDRRVILGYVVGRALLTVVPGAVHRPAGPTATQVRCSACGTWRTFQHGVQDAARRAS